MRVPSSILNAYNLRNLNLCGVLRVRRMAEQGKGNQLRDLPLEFGKLRLTELEMEGKPLCALRACVWRLINQDCGFTHVPAALLSMRDFRTLNICRMRASHTSANSVQEINYTPIQATLYLQLH